MKNVTCLALALLLVLAGCAGIGVEITETNNKISLPHYSIVAPANKGWRMVKPDQPEAVDLNMKPNNSTVFYMRFATNFVADESMKSWTAKQIADDYRNGEKADMIAKSVMSRQHVDPQDVVMGEEMVGSKKFYTMDYVRVGGGVRQSASLYLYFPKEQNIDRFVVAIFVQGTQLGVSQERSLKPEFLEVLKSLQWRN